MTLDDCFTFFCEKSMGSGTEIAKTIESLTLPSIDGFDNLLEAFFIREPCWDPIPMTSSSTHLSLYCQKFDTSKNDDAVPQRMTELDMYDLERIFS